MTVVEKNKTEAKLPLDSLEIKGYRAFKELTIPKLARVNLITGKNNVGKTSLLEAIYLFVRQGSPGAFWEVLHHRGQLMSDSLSSTRSQVEPSKLLEAVVRTFQGAVIPDSVLHRTELAFVLQSSNLRSLNVSIDLPKLETGDNTPVGISTRVPQNGPIAGRSLLYALDRIIDPIERVYFESEYAFPCNAVWIRGLDNSRLSGLWDNLSLTELKDSIVAQLQIINPEIIDVALRGDSGLGLGRVPYIRRSSASAPEPLSQLGDGMSRLFDIAVALANSSEGVLLIDEVNNGLHYSVLTDVWATIFELAHQLNVQVFATTHSWECIEAFQLAAAESEDDGALIRLQNKDGNIRATVFDEEDLQVITRDQIEVR